MFDSLSDRLAKTIKNLRGQGRITEDNIKDSMRDVRMALLEADVALPVVRDFVERVKQRAVGQEVMSSLSPGQALIKIVNEELVSTMGEANEALNLSAQSPAVVLMAGLQGAGKTTTVAKLAKLLQDRHKKKVMVVSCDVYRPAAIKQLQTLATQVGATFYPSEKEQKPVDIARAALDAAKKQFHDVLLVDTAGRLHIDEDMMREIQQIHQQITPVETLFVVDSMTGQDAANTAKAFNGAALSIRQITGKPIKFLGAGEKVEALEPFHPDRLASRILGMGDVLSLVEEVQRSVDVKEAAKLATKFKKGHGFDFNDLKSQMEQMMNMGGLGGLLDKLPGMGGQMANLKDKVNDKDVQRLMLFPILSKVLAKNA